MLESPGVHLRSHGVGCIRLSLELQTQIPLLGFIDDY